VRVVHFHINILQVSFISKRRTGYLLVNCNGSALGRWFTYE
jgi:hypothetical protein